MSVYISAIWKDIERLSGASNEVGLEVKKGE
jgi:hypothetical protein